jgi:Na+-transporting methylmalonyl-CoA/oxaloacetate decarboxylase gamma subunit
MTIVFLFLTNVNYMNERKLILLSLVLSLAGVGFMYFE